MISVIIINIWITNEYNDGSDECDEDMVISSTESSRNIFNKEQLDQWLRVFMVSCCL